MGLYTAADLMNLEHEMDGTEKVTRTGRRQKQEPYYRFRQIFVTNEVVEN